MLTPDMKSVIETQKLCFAATVTPDGKPNLSPKGTISVFNDDTIFFCDLGSPNTRNNLLANPYMEINVVDILSRRGYRFFGKASVLTSGEIYSKALQMLTSEGEFNFKVNAIVMMNVERTAPLISPGYLHVSDEWEMREIYKHKRPQLDGEFEENIEEKGPVRGGVR